MKTLKTLDIITYIETPRARSTPVKIDAILEDRLRAFARARRIRRFTFLSK